MSNFLNIDAPCSKKWAELSEVDSSHNYCDSCEKQVIDFTSWQREKVIDYLKKNERTCGRFYKHQLDYSGGEIEATILSVADRQKNPRHAIAILVLSALLLTAGELRAQEAPKTNATLPIIANTDSCNSGFLRTYLDTDSTPTISETIEFSFLEIMGEVGVQLPNDSVNEPLYYAFVSKKPTFQGSDVETLTGWIGQNTHYPKSAIKDSIEGKVFVRFVISESGDVQEARVVRGAHPTLDSAALNTVGRLPKFIPGENHGKKVRVQVVVPINFKLE